MVPAVVSDKYTIRLQLEPETMRLINRLKAEAERTHGRPVSRSEVVDAVCAQVAAYIERRDPPENLQATGHRGLPGHRQDVGR